MIHYWDADVGGGIQKERKIKCKKKKSWKICLSVGEVEGSLSETSDLDILIICNNSQPKALHKIQ